MVQKNLTLVGLQGRVQCVGLLEGVDTRSVGWGGHPRAARSRAKRAFSSSSFENLKAEVNWTPKRINMICIPVIFFDWYVMQYSFTLLVVFCHNISRSNTNANVFWLDCEEPGKIAVRFLRTGRFLAVSIRVSRFLLRFHLQKPCGFSQSSLVYFIGELSDRTYRLGSVTIKTKCVKLNC